MSTLRERMRDAARTAAAAVRREDDDALGGDVFASTTPNARAMRGSSGWNASTRMRVMDKPAAAVMTPTRGEEEDAARRARRRWRAEFDRVKADKLASDASPTTTQQRQEERVVRVWGDAVTTSMTRRRAQKDGYRGAEPTTSATPTSASLKEKFQRTVRERDEARARVDAMRLESESVVTTHEAPAAAAMDDGGDVEREVLQILREVVQETNRATVSAAAAPAVTPASKLVNIAAPVVSSSPVPSSPLRARSLDAKMDYSNARRSRQSGRLEKKSREEICALALAHVKQRQITWRTIATIIVAIVAVIAGLARRRLPVVETTDERRFKCPEFVSNNVLEEALEPSWRSALEDARATHDAHIARGDALGAKTIRAHSKRARDAQRALGALNADIERFFASVSADADTRSRTTPDTTADTTTTDTTTAADRARVKFAVARARALARAADAFDALRVLLADDAPL